jgi:hypothetical protein
MNLKDSVAFLRRISLNCRSDFVRVIRKKQFNRLLQLEKLALWRPLAQLDRLYGRIFRTKMTYFGSVRRHRGESEVQHVGEPHPRRMRLSAFECPLRSIVASCELKDEAAVLRSSLFTEAEDSHASRPPVIRISPENQPCL